MKRGKVPPTERKKEREKERGREKEKEKDRKKERKPMSCQSRANVVRNTTKLPGIQQHLPNTDFFFF